MQQVGGMMSGVTAEEFSQMMIDGRPARRGQPLAERLGARLMAEVAGTRELL